MLEIERWTVTDAFGREEQDRTCNHETLGTHLLITWLNLSTLRTRSIDWPIGRRPWQSLSCWSVFTAHHRSLVKSACVNENFRGPAEDLQLGYLLPPPPFHLLVTTTLGADDGDGLGKQWGPAAAFCRSPHRFLAELSRDRAGALNTRGFTRPARAIWPLTSLHFICQAADCLKKTHPPYRQARGNGFHGSFTHWKTDLSKSQHLKKTTKTTVANDWIRIRDRKILSQMTDKKIFCEKGLPTWWMTNTRLRSCYEGRVNFSAGCKKLVRFIILNFRKY